MAKSLKNNLKSTLQTSNILRSLNFLLIMGFFFTTTFSGTSVQAGEKNTDPFEGFNRRVDAFNNTIDRAILLPLAKSWKAVVPKPIDNGLSNVFRNFRGLVVITNDFLQGKFTQGFSDTLRFLVNSTIGVGGFFDVAANMGLESHDEDFGQTLGRWNVPSGPYIVLPFLGPSSLRDGIGLFPDNALNLINGVNHIPTRNTLYTIQFIDTRADLISLERAISGDRYIFIRNGYLQRREFLISDGLMDDDFPDEEFYDDFDDPL